MGIGMTLNGCKELSPPPTFLIEQYTIFCRYISNSLFNYEPCFSVKICSSIFAFQISNTELVLNPNQISAKRGTASKFEAQANLKVSVPNSKRSSILIYEIWAHMNAKA